MLVWVLEISSIIWLDWTSCKKYVLSIWHKYLENLIPQYYWSDTYSERELCQEILVLKLTAVVIVFPSGLSEPLDHACMPWSHLSQIYALSWIQWDSSHKHISISDMSGEIPHSLYMCPVFSSKIKIFPDIQIESEKKRKKKKIWRFFFTDNFRYSSQLSWGIYCFHQIS